LINIQHAEVTGGSIAFTTFGPSDSEHVIYAPHGITANMMTWVALSNALPEAFIIAPDLRGRGRSNSLEGSFGLGQHALDAVAILDHLGIEKYHIVGHSMGGFVSVRLAAIDADRVQSVTLVDGGLPLTRPVGVSDENLVKATLGPAAQRLGMTFDSELQYLDFWRDHPAFSKSWGAMIENYLKHDLSPVSGGYRPSASIPAVSADILELFGGDDYLEAMRCIEVPVTFIRAPKGLLDEDPLYAKDLSKYSTDQFQAFQAVEAEGINHYTILLSEQGANQVATVFEEKVKTLRKVTS
jgi:lipase